jgi:beta-lactamase regulating signal transducer with metallopeptidase domain/N-acetylneuraminic acid mutarotase
MEGLLLSAASWLALLGRISLQASVLIAWCHAFWLLVMLRLVLPVSLQSRASVFNWLPFKAPPITSVSRPAAPVVLTAPTLQAVAKGPVVTSAAASPADNARPVIFPASGKLILEAPDTKGTAMARIGENRATIWRWLAYGWLAGVVLLSARVLIESGRLSRSVAPKRLVTDSAVLELLEDCKQLMGVHVPVVLVQTERVSSPVLYGFVRPRLLLPTGLLQQFSRDELRFVFLHELAHIRRHDIALSWLMTILQVLHWFNPLVWFAFARMKADRELACDALVLSCTGDGEQKAYGRTMLRLLEDFVPRAPFPAMAGILEESSQLATRIRCIASFSRRSPSPAWALALIMVLALAALTDERVEAATSSSSVWPARFLITRPGGDADIRAVTLRPEPGVQLQQALRRGGLRLAADIEATNAINDGYKFIAAVDGLGSDRWMRCAREGTVSPRVAHSVIWTGRELLVWGGGAQDIFKRTGARYDPVTDTWRPISTNGAPSGRWHHAAQWTGREMIVWGGRGNFYPTNHFNDGARYNPETDSWQPINANGAPAARSQMISVWTGKEMIVWGGRGDGGTNAYDRPFNDGARYNPETDSWTPMAACPELRSRYDAAAVWTGRELLIWGGGARTGRDARDQHSYFTYNTGGRYDPARDQWTLLPQEGSPTGRYKHTAIWNGREMLVWGGTTALGDAAKPTSIALNDGARFNPATGLWSPISTNGAPSERSSHMAVWTGKEMIIWGGANARYDCLNTGGRYNPATDRWMTLTVENAPAPRYMMRPDSGIWTGKQLLVVGGYDLNTEFSVSHGWLPAPAMHLYQLAR